MVIIPYVEYAPTSHNYGGYCFPFLPIHVVWHPGVHSEGGGVGPFRHGAHHRLCQPKLQHDVCPQLHQSPGHPLILLRLSPRRRQRALLSPDEDYSWDPPSAGSVSGRASHVCTRLHAQARSNGDHSNRSVKYSSGLAVPSHWPTRIEAILPQQRPEADMLCEGETGAEA